jgi:hypothetical protein
MFRDRKERSWQKMTLDWRHYNNGKNSLLNLLLFILINCIDRTLEGAGWSKEGLRREGFKITAMEDYEKTDKLWYYVAPSLFIGGDKTSAYNGWLEYDLGMSQKTTHYLFESILM